MKVGIVTIYNSSNYGAFLQAKALEVFLEQNGQEIAFVKTGARKPVKKLIYESAVSLVKGRFSASTLVFDIKKERAFLNYTKCFRICKKSELTRNDLCLFGSDEIWNIKKLSTRCYPIFWGVGINKFVRKVSYAPSINQTSKEQILNYKKGLASLKNFNHISVRDVYSQKVLEEILEREISLVLDPTLLHEIEFYHQLEEPISASRYILIYSYGMGINKAAQEAIQSFARQKGLKIISVGNRNAWCDESLVVSPGEFLSYVKNAAYCFTDTFHGTVFSLIYHKNVGIFLGKAKKVEEILNMFEMRQCIVSSKDEILNLDQRNYDFSIMDSKIIELRKKSVDYLLKCLQK